MKKVNEIYSQQQQEDIASISIDYMENLLLPHMEIFYYFRQLWIHVFGVHKMKNGNSEFHLYHEGLAKRGPNKVCSTFLDDYMK